MGRSWRGYKATLGLYKGLVFLTSSGAWGEPRHLDLTLDLELDQPWLVDL